jgi:5-methyltetrahydrofolate--homocysteine methyltransferase
MPNTRRLLEEHLQHVLLLDGAMRSLIQRRKLEELGLRGERFRDHSCALKGDNDLIAITRPDVMQRIHEEDLEAGADIIETDTFDETAICQAHYRLQRLAREMNREAARIARSACDQWAAVYPDKSRFVAGSVGQTNRTLSTSPDVSDPAMLSVTFDQVREAIRNRWTGAQTCC